MSMPDQPAPPGKHNGGFAGRGTGNRIRKRAGGDREGLPPDVSRSSANADKEAAKQTDEQVELAKSMYLGVMKHPFMQLDEKMSTMVRGGIQPRDAFVLLSIARGATKKEVSAAAGLEDVSHILDKFRDQLEALRIEVQMEGLISDVPRILKAQGEVAQDKLHEQFAAAGRNVLGVYFPNRGAPTQQTMIAGRDIVTAGGAVVNAEQKIALAAIHEMPMEEVEAEIKKIEATFERPAPPGGE
jgi:hypothetical protein